MGLRSPERAVSSTSFMRHVGGGAPASTLRVTVTPGLRCILCMCARVPRAASSFESPSGVDPRLIPIRVVCRARACSPNKSNRVGMNIPSSGLAVLA
eukprot:scaffold78838_cov58-Phaeocystis_antarctica.AAC.6